MRDYDLTRAARERRQSCWQAGYDHAVALAKSGHFTPPADWDAYDRYLWQIGIANYITAQARDLTPPDAPPPATVVVNPLGGEAA